MRRKIEEASTLLSVDLGLVEWFNKAIHSWEDAHYSLVMNLEGRAPWLLVNRCSFVEEDKADTDGVEPKMSVQSCRYFSFFM